MDNPFVYGEVVPASAFVNRSTRAGPAGRRSGGGPESLPHLPTALREVVADPPRAGGDGEARGAHRRAHRSAVSGSYVAFLEGYARAASRPETKWDRGRHWLRDAIRSARAEVQYTPERLPRSAITVSFPGVRSDRDVSRLAQEIFQLPARLADARQRKVVVALDEFQAINGFNGGSIEHALRAAVQHQRDVGYVFAGSEPSLMERMLGPRRPFYKAGPVMRLDKIPPDEFASFIDARFTRSGLRPEPGLGAAIVDLAGNLPYDIQRLAHETWDEVRAGGRRRATLDDLHRALRRLLTEQHMMFEAHGSG
jgi:hypothetical protein